MSWIEKLYRTYENNTGNIGNDSDKTPLLPICHSTQNAHINVVLNGAGGFLRANTVSKENALTIIPTTEKSSGRTNGVAPHALCDKIQYVAKDYAEYGGRGEEDYHAAYFEALENWFNKFQNEKLGAVLTYIRTGRVVQDLVAAGILQLDAHNMLRVWHKGDSMDSELFKLLVMKKQNGVEIKNQRDAFVRFSVEIPGDLHSNLWTDPVLWAGWSSYYASCNSDQGLCFVTGEQVVLAAGHPAKIRNAGDSAKLISSNDSSGYTYRGRFTEADQVCGVSFDVTQKAHSALRWLIARQGRRDGDQAVVAWAVSGADVPDPCVDTLALLGLADENEADSKSSGYTAQDLGRKLSSLIAGYSVKLGPADEVIVMGLDSATPGRMAITFYRELSGSEFLERVLSWHQSCSWVQQFSKDKIFIGAPSPRDIAEAAYGRRIDDKLRKATVARLLPCIIDGVPVPQDLVNSCVRHAICRHAIESWEWEKALGIACALYRHYHKERKYIMPLERDRKTRDYLYGRLLAAADGLESFALYLAQEKRPTNAARLMQRFADRPCSTWKTIELALAPYKARLGGRAKKYEDEIREAMNLFVADEYVKDTPLSGEFLIGFHSQRAALRPKPESEGTEKDAEEINL